MDKRLASRLDSISEETSIWGIKAVNLSKIIKNGFTVPSGFVISSSFFLEYKKIRNTDNKCTYLNKMDTFLDKEIRKLNLSKKGLIFRSSANLEGVASNSFAGIFDSVQLQANQPIASPLETVWESALSTASYAYCSKLGVDVNNINMAVIIQEFFFGSLYGVIQTRDVINQLDCVIIEYTNRKFDSVVSGKDNSSMVALSRHGDTITCNCNLELTLNQKYILLYAAQTIEALFMKPVEIEFSLENNNLVILQVRVLT